MLKTINSSVADKTGTFPNPGTNFVTTDETNFEDEKGLNPKNDSSRSKSGFVGNSSRIDPTTSQTRTN